MAALLLLFQNSCYFYDPSCITPYSVKGNKSKLLDLRLLELLIIVNGIVNTNCRKVIQYVNYTDSFDDAEGHGTHGT
jgi:hypothetical protein